MIVQFQELRRISIVNNGLNQVEFLDQMLNLEYLDLSNNNIANLNILYKEQEHDQFFPQLKTLILNSNKITELKAIRISSLEDL